jgi:hypothetical protein
MSLILLICLPACSRCVYTPSFPFHSYFYGFHPITCRLIATSTSCQWICLSERNGPIRPFVYMDRLGCSSAIVCLSIDSLFSCIRLASPLLGRIHVKSVYPACGMTELPTIPSVFVYTFSGPENFVSNRCGVWIPMCIAYEPSYLLAEVSRLEV